MRKHSRPGAAIFLCILIAGLAGLLGHDLIPAGHLTRETLDFVKAATGVVAVLTSLVLGLLIFSAKGTFDTQDRDLRRFAAAMSHLDLLLRHYGPQTDPARAALRELAEQMLADIWPDQSDRRAAIESPRAAALIERVPILLFGLSPADDTQRYLHRRALELVSELIEIRWQLIEDTVNAVPPPFLVILVAWLSIIFASFGLTAPLNATVLVVLTICAVSVAAAIILVIDLVSPFDGVIRISNAPLRKATDYLFDKRRPDGGIGPAA